MPDVYNRFSYVQDSADVLPNNSETYFDKDSLCVPNINNKSIGYSQNS